MGASFLCTRRILGIAGLALAASLVGCDNKTKHADLPEPLTAPAVKRSAPAPTAKSESDHDDLNRAALDLQAALDDVNAKSAPRSDIPSLPVSGDVPQIKPAGRIPDLGANARSRRGGGNIAANQPASVPDAVPATTATKSSRKSDLVERTPAQKRQDAIAELASQLKPGIQGAKEPLRVAIPLFGLDAISSGAAAANLDEIASSVSPEQRRSLQTVRDLVRSFGTDPNLTGAQPDALARALRTRADELAPVSQTQTDLALGAVALCQRVDGFGRFTELGGNTFLAGRPAAMIIYSEIENFSQIRATDAASAGQWRVELGQSIRLYLDSDGSQQLTLPESVVRDQAVSKRRDFYLVQRVDLPKTLSVGNYNLKITVRDLASGALVERSIPIRIVADVSALRDSASASSRTASEYAGKPGNTTAFADPAK